jgi:hypothetical protein
MKVKLPTKNLGQSWSKWFIEMLLANDCTKVSSQKFVHGDLEIRIFRAEKFYHVYKNGVKITEDLQFTFPHLTAVLYP